MMKAKRPLPLAPMALALGTASAWAEAAKGPNQDKAAEPQTPAEIADMALA